MHVSWIVRVDLYTYQVDVVLVEHVLQAARLWAAPRRQAVSNQSRMYAANSPQSDPPGMHEHIANARASAPDGTPIAAGENQGERMIGRSKDRQTVERTVAAMAL